MSEQMIADIGKALSPLVNEHMDEEMRAAWLDDLARAAHSVIAGKVAEQRRALELARTCLRANSYGERDVVMQLIDAALAPHPKARNE